jgi:hypothetical protein
MEMSKGADLSRNEKKKVLFGKGVENEWDEEEIGKRKSEEE